MLQATRNQEIKKKDDIVRSKEIGEPYVIGFLERLERGHRYLCTRVSKPALTDLFHRADEVTKSPEPSPCNKSQSAHVKASATLPKSW